MRCCPTSTTGKPPARCRAGCTAKAAEQGLLGVSFPEDVGGQGGDLLDSVALMEGCFEAGASSGLMAALFTGGIALPHLVADRARAARAAPSGSTGSSGRPSPAS